MIGTALLMVGGVFALIGLQFAVLLALDKVADWLLKRRQVEHGH